MELVTHRLVLDTRRVDSGQRISVKRGDTAREIVASLARGGKPYRIDEGCTAVFYARKSDGVALFNACTISQNTIRYAFTGQTTNVVGLVECEFRLYSADALLLTTPRFEIIVEDTVHQEGDIPDSSPEYTALTEMVAQGTALIADLEGIQKEMELTRTVTGANAERAAQAATMADGYAEDALAAANAAAAAQLEIQKAHADTELLVGHAVTAREAAEAAAARAEEAADRAEAAGGGTLSAAGDGDDIVITTTGLAVTAEGDDIILGG